MKTTNAEKSKVIAEILKQETCPVEGDTYYKATKGLRKLSLDTLQNLRLILTFKQYEAIELARQVDKILAK